jgi:diadenylate cyclase
VAPDPAHRSRELEYLALLAPGSPLRDGFERILRGRTGALVVLGDTPEVIALCTGGFQLDVPYTPTALRELSKMDGGIVMTTDLSRIVRAGVQLMPDPQLETEETGTRHRTADRVSRQTGVPVATVSASMSTIALFIDGRRRPLESSEQILARANQALQTLERYRERLWQVTGRLSTLEVEDQATIKDLVLVAQRQEMIRRLQNEISEYVVELGTDGRLLTLQLNELVAGVAGERELVVRDYLPPATGRKAKTADDVLLELDAVSPTDLLDIGQVARALQLGGAEQLDAAVTPRGYRLLAKVPRLPGAVIDRLIEHFGHLQKLLAASIDDLQTVDGVGENRARTVREGLSRLAESSILERYV